MVPLFLNIDEAIRLHQAGESLEKIGRKFGVSSATVKRRMQSAGYQFPPRVERIRATFARRDAEIGPVLTPLFARYDAGEGWVSLAAEAGVGQRRFRRLLVESGRTVRPQRDTLGMRYTRMTVAERAEITRAANIAKRGRRANPRSLERRARTMEVTLQLASRSDLALAVWLAQRGVRLVLQKAEGIYNLDIAMEEPRVAVEVVGASGEPKLRALSRSRSTPAERREYLFDRGWRLIEVGTALKHLRPECADRIVTLLHEASTNEPTWGQHCVIRGDGQDAPGGKLQP